RLPPRVAGRRGARGVSAPRRRVRLALDARPRRDGDAGRPRGGAGAAGGLVSARALAFLLVLGLAGGARAQAPTPAPPRPSANPDAQGPEDLPAGDCFSPGQTESRLVVPRTKIERFAMPVVDTHSHVYAETPQQIAEWVALMDRIGVRETLILTGETGAKFRELTARFAGAHPGRFAMGAGMV